jgi:hypothetical protein
VREGGNSGGLSPYLAHLLRGSLCTVSTLESIIPTSGGSPNRRRRRRRWSRHCSRRVPFREAHTGARRARRKRRATRALSAAARSTRNSARRRRAGENGGCEPRSASTSRRAGKPRAAGGGEGARARPGNTCTGTGMWLARVGCSYELVSRSVGPAETLPFSCPFRASLESGIVRNLELLIGAGSLQPDCRLAIYG